MDKKLSKKLNILYGLLQGGYWMQYCMSLSYASFIMLDRGYDNARIGIILAVANALAVVFQNLVAKIADRSKKISLTSILVVCYVIEALMFGFIIMLGKAGAAFTVVIVVLAVISASTQGHCNALCYRLESESVKINFGTGRAVGSACFAIISIIAGNVAEKSGNANAIPVLGFLSCAFLVVVLILIQMKADTRSRITEEQQNEKDNIIIFFKRYSPFLFLLVGVLLFYMSHSFINNFLFQILSNVGGTEADLGGVLAFAAVTELPPMIFYNKLERKFGTKPLFIVGAVSFFIKSILTFAAVNVLMVYIATFFQMLSFAIYIPAGVSFVNQIMEKRDGVQGQAMLNTAVSVAFLIASITGGMIDRLGMKVMLLVYSIISLIGAVIAVLTLRIFAIESKN